MRQGGGGNSLRLQVRTPVMPEAIVPVTAEPNRSLLHAAFPSGKQSAMGRPNHQDWCRKMMTPLSGQLGAWQICRCNSSVTGFDAHIILWHANAA